jgi:CDP-diacylglycerol pyrophosphatase
MDTKTKSLISLAVIAAAVAGALIANGLNAKPSKDQVREALYEQCVNSSAYAPKATNADDSLHCNRRSIDLMVAVLYNGSYMPPIDVAKYEAELDKYKHHN